MYKAALYLKKTLRALCPPLLWSGMRRARAKLRSLRRGERPEWEWVPEGWARSRSDPRIKGWNVSAVLETEKSKWKAFVDALDGSGPLGIAHDIPLEWNTPVATHDYQSHNTLVSYAYVLALASSGKTHVSILDWGGGIGHYLILSRAILPDIEISYHCKDVPALASYGEELFPEARFYTDDSCLDKQYDLVLASGSLHYSEDWAAIVNGLASATKSYLYITRLPVASQVPSFVVLQRAYAYGYDTEYMCWALNREAFLDAVESNGMRLLREFLMMEHFMARDGPEAVTEYRGFLFSPADRS